LLPTEDTLVDFWSVGRLIDLEYHMDDFDMRTDSSPILGRALHLKYSKGEKCALTVDVFGNQLLHMLD